MDDRFVKVKNHLITSQNLTDLEFRIFCLLLSMANADGFCYPSIRTIANCINKSPGAVSKNLNSLIQKDFILKENRFLGKGKKTSNIYVINENYLVPNDKKNFKKEVNQNIQKIADYDWLDDERFKE